ncbi:MAG: glycosyltransferase family 2 protein [Gammaproteobacteria bacterium]
MKRNHLRYRFYRVIAAQVSALTRYYDKVVYFAAQPSDDGLLLDLVDAPARSIAADTGELEDLSDERDRRTAVLMNGNANYTFDFQATLVDLLPRLSRTSRVVLVTYNAYLEPLFRLANRLGLRRGAVPQTFITRSDLESIAELSGYDIVRLRPTGFFPWRLGGLGSMLNRLCAGLPVLRWLSLAAVVVLRPRKSQQETLPSLSIIVPARNERGNIASAVARLPDLGCPMEVVFVEGHSDDGTWEAIEALCASYDGPLQLRALRQTGRGKADAVRLGFGAARHELLVILDADLTMPPEHLPRFYQAYVEGHADFINGSRLVYPMEGDAMRSLNRLGNIFFAKAVSAVLDQRIGDTLCGTKLLARHDYARMIAWRRDFGDVDPFGDFELLFPAAVLGLGIADVPVRYRARTYGSTNIRRFRDGLRLFGMTWRGLVQVRMAGHLESVRTGNGAGARE